MLATHYLPLPKGSCQPQEPEERGKDEHHTWKGVETKHIYSNFNWFITTAETLFCILTVFLFVFTVRSGP